MKNRYFQSVTGKLFVSRRDISRRDISRRPIAITEKAIKYCNICGTACGRMIGERFCS
jgi:hypothetical protein